MEYDTDQGCEEKGKGDERLPAHPIPFNTFGKTV